LQPPPAHVKLHAAPAAHVCVHLPPVHDALHVDFAAHVCSQPPSAHDQLHVDPAAHVPPDGRAAFGDAAPVFAPPGPTTGPFAAAARLPPVGVADGAAVTDAEADAAGAASGLSFLQATTPTRETRHAANASSEELFTR
jgi:hypothetical protein